jgi:hypothetical protein
MRNGLTTCQMVTLNKGGGGADGLNQAKWGKGKSGNKNPKKKKKQVQATRQSSRLRSHGGLSIQKMATKRKQVQNLEIPGNNFNNSFAILNNIDDDVLVKSAKDLDITLAENEEGCYEQITAIKAEEKLRAHLAEANYLAHLENLAHNEGGNDEDILDLTIIDNSQRDVREDSDSNLNSSTKNARNQKKSKKNKRRGSCSGTLEALAGLKEENRLESIFYRRTLRELAFKKQ